MIYPATDQYIDLAKTTLENGEVIVYPTDTLYGFGVDATNSEAIQRLNRLKGKVKPLSIVLESVDHMHAFAEFNGKIKSEINIIKIEIIDESNINCDEISAIGVGLAGASNHTGRERLFGLLDNISLSDRTVITNDVESVYEYIWG